MTRLQLQEAFKLALSVTLFYWLAMALQFPSPKNGAIAIAVTSMATVGDSWNKGLLRIFGTAVGVVAGLAILTVFAQSRWGLMLAMRSPHCVDFSTTPTKMDSHFSVLNKY